ncbi:hypothetical protein Tco_0112061 [Tanacetum coccineum]
MVDKQKITYTFDMLCATLKLPVETPAHPFIAPTTLKYIQPFLKIVSYQGLVDKVSSFYTKNLAQSWQTMFTVFHRCLISKTSGHDQTKINLLQIFHVIINRVHVDYASLLWWKFDSITKRLEEDYHSIKDDVTLVSAYTTGNVTVKGMLIPDEFLTDDIRETKEYKDYTKEKPRAPRTPNPADVVDNVVPEKKKGKQIFGETSTPRNSFKEKLLEEDVEKIIEGEDEECYASEFVDSIFLNNEEDSSTRIESESHKENLETIYDADDDEEKKDDKKDDDDDDDDDDHNDHALVRTRVTGSLEIRNEKMQTPIPSPSISTRIYLSSDKTISQELTATVSPTPATTS